MTKRAFDIDVAMERLPGAVAPYAMAALFELAYQGFGSPFEQLVACIISVRTLDETTMKLAPALFAAARTPGDMAKLSPDEIDERIRQCSFHAAKARNIHTIAQIAVQEHGGRIPCDFERLIALPGVGPKCANLVLGIACGQARVAVDIHVHRVTNRWGYVHTATPELTMVALEDKLPRRYWVEINRLLVPFGKHVCTGRLPRCSDCPLLDMCQQVGVTTSR